MGGSNLLVNILLSLASGLREVRRTLVEGSESVKRKISTGTDLDHQVSTCNPPSSEDKVKSSGEECPLHAILSQRLIANS
jgi:hypothetical protein